MANDKKLTYEIDLVDGKFIKGMREVNAEMAEIITQSAHMKAAFKDIGVGLASLTAAGFGANAMRAPINAAATMQQSLLGVKAELIGTGKTMQLVSRELDLVQKNAMAVQAATAFSASEIVDLQKELLKGGATLSQIAGDNGAAMAAAQLAQYEGVMASYAGQGLISIATPFGLAGDKFSYLADQITRASAASLGGFTEFAEGAKYAAPQLSALGVAIEAYDEGDSGKYSKYRLQYTGTQLIMSGYESSNGSTQFDSISECQQPLVHRIPFISIVNIYKVVTKVGRKIILPIKF